MTTVINNPGKGEGSDSSVGLIIGLVILLAILGLFFVYALPAIRGVGTQPQNGNVNINVKLPSNVTLPAITIAP